MSNYFLNVTNSMILEKHRIWELVVKNLPGGMNDLRNQLFYMVIDNIFDIEENACEINIYDEIIEGKILSGVVEIGDILIINRSYYKIVGIEIADKLLNHAEYGDYCRIRLKYLDYLYDEDDDDEEKDDNGFYEIQDDDFYRIDVGASVSKVYENGGNLRINWNTLLASIKKEYGVTILKKELSNYIYCIGQFIDTLESVISTVIARSKRFD